MTKTKKPKRRIITAVVELSLAPGVTAAAARRELRTRVNDLCCYSLDDPDGAWPKGSFVRVKSCKAGGR